MIGSIAGDVVGSAHEFTATKTVDFPLFTEAPRFTDDTVLTIAIADAVLTQRPYGETLRKYALAFPNRLYGAGFMQWVEDEAAHPYSSWGNGSAMRVSAVGFAFNDEATVLREAGRCAEVTHDHPEGIKGAQATALAVFMARTGHGKEAIRKRVSSEFGYDLDRTVEEIRPEYVFEVSCQRTVPEAIVAFLDSTSYESCIRLAVSLGGDADTLACIAGGIAHAHYGGVPTRIAKPALGALDPRLLEVALRFCRRYQVPGFEDRRAL
jgi:ADP-ribosylglycohydrolase